MGAKVAKESETTKGNDGNPEKRLHFSELISIFVATNSYLHTYIIDTLIHINF